MQGDGDLGFIQLVHIEMMFFLCIAYYAVAVGGCSLFHILDLNAI